MVYKWLAHVNDDVQSCLQIMNIFLRYLHKLSVTNILYKTYIFKKILNFKLHNGILMAVYHCQFPCKM